MTGSGIVGLIVALVEIGFFYIFMKVGYVLKYTGKYILHFGSKCIELQAF